MKLSLRRFGFIIFSLLLTNSLWCQSGNLQFKHLSVIDGLSNNSVIAIAQDTLGQMWFGTRNGLNKYDGTHFEVYKNDPNDSTSIGNSDILSITEDRDGYIWVGTYNGLNKYDPLKNTFKRYNQTEEDNSLINPVVICSRVMASGEIWFGTANGISVYDKKQDAFTNIPYTKHNPTGLPYNNVQKIFVDSMENIWVATAAGLAKLISRDDDVFVFKQFEWKENQDNLFIQDIIESAPNTLGLATKYNGYVLFDTTVEKFITPPFIGIPPTADVRVLQHSDKESIWLGTTQGIKIIGPQNEITVLESHRNNLAGLSQNFIKSIFKDRNGTIWAGTYNAGINMWNASNENFVHFTNNELDNNVVTAIISDKNSNIYFGTEGGDLTVLTPQQDILDVINVSDPSQFRPNSIQTLLLDDENRLWIGVLNYGVYVYDIRAKRILDHVISDELNEYLKNTGVYVIKKDKKGMYWIGTFGKGLVKYDLQKKEFKVFGRTLGQEPRLSSNIIKTLVLDNDGNVWAGGLGGLNFIHFKNDDTYEVTKYFVDAFSGDDIKTLFEDSTQQIWVGTKSKGLQKFNGTGFDRVLLDGHNSISTIYTILEGGQRHLWMSSDKGIIDYDISNNTYVIYDQQDKLNTNEFSPNAGLLLEGSRFYFGGAEGVISFDPTKIVKNEHAPKVVLSDLKIKNQSVPIHRDQETLTKSIAYTQSITLSHDNANFSLNYALPNFINPHNNHYAYRLIGLDDSWIYTDKTEASYTLQKPGDYLFEVKGANNDGVWNNTPTTLKIVVKPAPWKSVWAYLAYSLLTLSAMFTLYTIIKSKARLKQDLRWEQMENERKEEAHQAKLEFFTNISHDLRTPLTLILGPLQQLLAEYKGSSLMYKKLLTIESSANHLLQLINRLMDFRKLENRQSKLQVAEGNIVKFLQEIYLSFTEFAKLKGYTYTFENAQDHIAVFYDRPKLEQVFYNLISNAFKYTPNGGNIAIEIREEANTVYVSVEDSGIGIKDKHIDKVFERFFEIPPVGDIKEGQNPGTGIGLSIAKNIVKLHSGTITVSSKEHQGSKFEVTLPLGKKHLAKTEIIDGFRFSDDLVQYTSQLTDNEAVFYDSIDDLAKDKNVPVVLIVEDNKQLRSFIKNLLKNEYSILEAENGKQGLKKALKHIPDLIVSDVMMPEMAGTDLCGQIKQNLRTSHIPVILLTARTSLIYKFKGLESGADDYISKPFNIKEFKLRVKNLLDSARRLKDKFSSETDLSPSELTVSSLDEKLLKKAINVVEDNISNEQFDITAFCKELGVSRTILFAKIKAWTNFTPNGFINEMRLKRAAQYLEQGDINISEVSYNVGFKDPKYFSRCFQKKHGMTPSKYLKKFSDTMA